MRYSTKTDVMGQEVIPALGEFVGDYDLDAIFEEAYEMRHEENEKGQTVGDVWFQQREGVDFWEVAQRHDHSGS